MATAALLLNAQPVLSLPMGVDSADAQASGSSTGADASAGSGGITSAADAGSGPSAAPSRAAADTVTAAASPLGGPNQTANPLDAAHAAAGRDAATPGPSPSADLTALAGLARAVPGAEPKADAVERSIPLSVSDPNWPRAVAAQVHLFAAANVQSATLKLSPEHLGPVEVHIDVQSAQVNVSFDATHAETRSALEQSVPALRTLFAQSGLTLGQASVQGGETRPGSQSSKSRAQTLANAGGESAPIAAVTTRGVGLIDEYA